MEHMWHKNFLCISILFCYMQCLWVNESQFIYKYWVQIYRVFFNIFTSRQYRNCENTVQDVYLGDTWFQFGQIADYPDWGF